MASDAQDCAKNDVFAYVWPGVPGKPAFGRYVYICPGFWVSSTQGLHIFHELGRLVGIDGPNFGGDKFDAYVWDLMMTNFCFFTGNPKANLTGIVGLRQARIALSQTFVGTDWPVYRLVMGLLSTVIVIPPRLTASCQ